MAFPVSAAPFPAGSANPAIPYSGTMIPELWSGKLIEKFYNSTVLSVITNTDYEGELKKYGDKVKIRTKPTINIRRYQAGQALQVDRPSSPIVEMVIDQGIYFNCIEDDVHKIQSDLNLMNMWSDDAAQQMKIFVDRDVLLGILNQADPANRGTAAGAVSQTINLGVTGQPLSVVNRDAEGGDVEIVDVLVRLGQALDEQNIPDDGRWVVLPSFIASMIKTSELRNAALSGDGQSTLRTGRLGMVDRFTIYSSNLLPSGVAAGLAAGEWVIYAGTSHAISFASQFTNMEEIRSESTFGSLIRGLQVSGWKVLDGKALTQAIVVAG